MKHFVTLLLILLISVWLGIELQTDPGYALFAYDQWTMEMPLWVVGLSWLVGYIAIYGLLKLINSVFGISFSINSWANRRRTLEAQRRSGKGLIALAEGHWKEAEKHLAKAAKTGNESALINYLAAAMAAQKQENYKSRDNYLRLAHDGAPDAEIAIGLTQAQLQLDRKQYEQALATLYHLRTVAPNHEYVLRLLQSLFVKLQDWQSLLALLPTLQKRKVLSHEKYCELENNVHRELLLQAGDAKDPAVLMKTWQQIPKALQREPELVGFYADCLLQVGEDDKAYEVLRDTLKRSWDSRLLQHYGDAKSSDNERQLSIAEGWLKNHRGDPELLYCLGRLSFRAKLWGKAKEYFEKSVETKPQLKVYRDLGGLLEMLQERDKAFRCYREGLKQSAANACH